MSKDAPVIVKFLADLDCILDTRLGTLLRIDPEITPRLVKSGYFDRDRDQFPGISTDQFNDLYAKRDRETLKASMMTPVVDFMKNFIKDSYEMNIETPFLREPKLVVNMFPYKLTPDEQTLIKSALISRTASAAEIELIDVDPMTFTPGWLKREINIFASYSPYEWLDALAKNGTWERDNCPGVMLITPLRIRDLSLKSVDLREVQSVLEEMVGPFIDLQLLSMRAFSADVFPKPKPKEAPKETKEST